MFPKFLLPSTVFGSRKRNAGWSPSPRSTTTLDKTDEHIRDEGYLNGHISYIQCSHCATDICLTSQIISKGFTGRHGRAYLVSAEPIACAVSVNAESSPTDSLPNTIIQKPVPRQLVTGAHTVSDINCAFCGNVLGWKYVAAEEESQRYKVGKFILETKRTMTSSTWESGSYMDSASVFFPRDHDEQPLHDSVEFDSQDEEECEDLFAGIWSPGLAIRRRSRKVDHRPSIFGLTG
ncbi:yippee putative zinc-binding protein [Aspergillus ambiguus]|uniref:yippee/mis18 family protein n=1 Tax=Aspergillus ambiguus TaxID=176160 RepID=UPI003CCD2944